MTDMMKVRIETFGPEFWRIKVTDAETGKSLPVLWDEKHGIDLRIDNYCLVAHVTLEIHEVDSEILAQVQEKIERVSPEDGAALEFARDTFGAGVIVRHPAAPESVDDFAARTVSLVTRKDDE
jgi:hypothetical protein